jgi:multidrug efflux pump subunit AcrB
MAPGAAVGRGPRQRRRRGPLQYGLFSKQSAILLVVSRQPDANIIQTVDAIQQQMPALRAFIEGRDLSVASDRSPGIRARCVPSGPCSSPSGS